MSKIIDGRESAKRAENQRLFSSLKRNCDENLERAEDQRRRQSEAERSEQFEIERSEAISTERSDSVQYISLKQLHAKDQDLRLDPTFEPDTIKLAEDAKRQLNDAEQKATAILEEAKKQAEILQNEALKKGYQEGFFKGEEAGKINVQEESNSLKNFFQNAIEEVSSLKSSILKEIEPEIVKLSLILAEKLVLNSFQIHPEAIASIIKNLIQMVDDEEEIKILVNPSVLPILEEYQHPKDEVVGEQSEPKGEAVGERSEAVHEVTARSQFLDIIKSKSKLKIEGDSQISEGGCLIVTNTKILDAQIETRLLEAAKTLQKATDDFA